MTDREIIELYTRRDERALRETQTAYGKYCEKIALNVLGDIEEARECANDALLKAWENIPPDDPRIFSAYLAAITRNIAISRYRYENAEKRGKSTVPLVLDDLADIIPSGTSVERTAEHREMIAEINRFLGGLPEINRTVFVLRFYMFEDIPDIAKRTGLRKREISAMLYRTKKQIKKHLEEEGYSI